jgi:hypothetical protein
MCSTISNRECLPLLALSTCLRQVEEQLRGNQGMGNSDDVEIARLEAENIQLRWALASFLKATCVPALHPLF